MNSKIRLVLAASAGICALVAQPASAAKMIGYWETYGSIPLGNVSSNYDVIDLAFATPSGNDGSTITWGQSVESDSQFRADVSTMHSRGKKVVMSIGGGGAPAMNLQNSGDVSNFVNSVESIVNSYGFDGIDLDDESGVFNLQSGDNDVTNPTTPAIKYYIQGAEQLASHYGSSFIISMANQTADMDAYGAYGYDANNGVVWGSYLPIIYALRGDNQIVQTQCYNSGGINARNGQIVNEGTNDFDVAATEMLILGYHMANGQTFPAIPQSEIAFGVPATPDAADGASFQSPSAVLRAAEYIGSGTSDGGSYSLEGGPYPGFAGVMTWDIDYDQNENEGLASTLHPYLSSIGGGSTGGSTTGGGTEAPYGGTPAAIPGTVQAENYDTGGQGVAYSVSSTNGSDNGYRSDGIDLETTTDTGGGVDLGWTAAGQWFKYTVNVGQSGTYSASFRVANGTTSNGTLALLNSSGATLATVTIAPTGGWQTWATVTANVNLSAGQQVLEMSQTSGGYNINYVAFALEQGATEGPYGGTPAAIPGTVQAENYDTGGQGLAYNVTSTNGTDNGYRSDGIDLETTTDTGGGVDLGWTSAGQWFNYTVNVASAGTYTIALRVANGSTASGTLNIQNSTGTNLTGNVTIPTTGGWQTWTTVNATATLPAGKQTLTVFQVSGGYNINYLTFGSSGISGSHTLAPQCATGSRLDDTGGSTTNGNKLQIWAATGGPNQAWTFTNIGGSNYTLQVNGAFCLDSAGATTSGTAATIWSCESGNANQSWTVTPVTGGDTVKDANAGLCLDVTAAGTANGTVVETYTCNGTNAQTWAIN